MKTEKIYAELALTWRHYALWREKSFAGYLAVLAGLAFAFSSNHSVLVRLAVFAGAFWASIAFWVLDYRNGQLLNVCQSSAAILDREHKGIFTALNDIRLNPKTSTFATYALAIDLLISGVIGASLAGASIYLSRLSLVTLDYVPRLIVLVGVPFVVYQLQRIRRQRWAKDRRDAAAAVKAEV